MSRLFPILLRKNIWEILQLFILHLKQWSVSKRAVCLHVCPTWANTHWHRWVSLLHLLSLVIFFSLTRRFWLDHGVSRKSFIVKGPFGTSSMPSSPFCQIGVYSPLEWTLVVVVFFCYVHPAVNLHHTQERSPLPIQQPEVKRKWNEVNGLLMWKINVKNQDVQCNFILTPFLKLYSYIAKTVEKTYIQRFTVVNSRKWDYKWFLLIISFLVFSEKTQYTCVFCIFVW